ncbi:DMT family transporter [Phenylobacterium sp.]|uniref:EamA family transporter n=1 Tax=Phenylobacterium sp. TaxID=1871053 RepID=UPI003565DDEC
MTPRPAGRAAILLPLAAVVTAMAAFQVSAAFAKSLFPVMGPQGAAALRLTLGAFMLLAISRPWRAWPKDAPWLAVAGLGVSVAAAVGFFYAAISRMPLGVAIALQFVGPLSVAVFGSRRIRDLVWAVLAAAGVWALVGHGAAGAKFDGVGVAYALGAAAGWAGYILCGRVAGGALGQSAAPLSVSIAAAIMLPIGVAHAGAALITPALLPLAAMVALFSAVIPFSLELYAMARMPSRTFAVFTSLEPAFGALSGWVLLHERLALAQMGGIAAVIAAAVGAAWSSAQTTRPLPTPE